MEEVIEGKDGVLFLAKSLHNIVDHITGKIAIDQNFFINFYKNIINRSTYCKSRNIIYKHIIYPDKSTVMKSYFPIADTISFSERYRPYFTDDVVDLGDCLQDTTKYFFKTDTHLNFDGKVKTSIEILKNFFDFNEQEIKQVFDGFRGTTTEMIGDLGSKINPIQKEIRYEIITRFLKRFHNQTGANDGLVIICFNRDKIKKNKCKRLLIFGDSFCERTLQFISYFYSEILFCRSRYFHDEVVSMFKPDHLITESAERYFSNVRLDDVAPRFDLIYGLKSAKYVQNTEFYRAYNAVLNYGRTQYNQFIDSFKNNLV
jgi:hypothetical protein